MENKTIRILSTRPLDEAALAVARNAGIIVDVISFIDTVPVNDQSLAQKISESAGNACTVIFTSMNAVDVVTHQLRGTKPLWKIFCMGNTTKQLVEDYFGKQQIVATASNATALANELIQWQKSATMQMPVLFFCGDQRREELPGKLREHGLQPEEIITYRTLETTHKLQDVFNGILFFSPSAVHSFFKTNKATAGTVFFAIGETTAHTIKTYTNNKIVIGETPSKTDLLKIAVDYFAGHG